MRMGFHLVVTLFALHGAPALAQATAPDDPSVSEPSKQDLARAAQNPVGDLISIPFQNNTSFGIGPDDRVQNVLNIQPVYPIKLSDKWNLITRTILPVISQPAPGSDRTNGIGDLQMTGFLSPRASGKWIWGLGAALVAPIASDDVLGSGKWSAGPSIVLLTMRGPWVVGGLVSNVWSFAGESARSDVNAFSFQYFINYNYPSGWYATSAPIITANWEAASGEKWTIPFGIGAGKIVKMGKLPVNISFSYFYNVEKPSNGPDWSVRLQAQLMFPK